MPLSEQELWDAVIKDPAMKTLINNEKLQAIFFARIIIFCDKLGPIADEIASLETILKTEIVNAEVLLHHNIMLMIIESDLNVPIAMISQQAVANALTKIKDRIRTNLTVLEQLPDLLKTEPTIEAETLNDIGVSHSLFQSIINRELTIKGILLKQPFFFLGHI